MRAPGILYALVFVLLFATVAGCAGLPSPALMGKSKYTVDFVDTVGPDGTQNTEFHSSIAAPAGDIAKIDPGATYKWQDGNGEFAVSGRGEVDSTAQASMLQEMNKQQLEAFQAGLNTALNALAPIIGQKVQSSDNQAAMKAETDAERLKAAIALVEEEMRKRSGR